MKFFKKRSNSIVIVFLLAAVIGSAWYLSRTPAVSEINAPASDTAKVRTGDLVVSAIGAGTVVPAAQVDLSFHTTGVLNEISVAVGSTVTAGQVLARLEDNLQAEVDFKALFSPQGVAQAEVAASNAQTALTEAENQLIYLIGLKAWYWEGQLKQAEAALLALDAGASQAEKDAAQARVDVARGWWNYWQEVNMNELADWYKVYDVKTRKTVIYHLVYDEVSELELASARANLESARVSLKDAQAALEIIKAGSTNALTDPIVALGPQMAKLEQARLALERSRLTTPIDGTVTSLDAPLGQNVGTASMMTISTTDSLLVRFYLDESDLTKALVGKPVIITVDAYPDAPLHGQTIMVEPALQVVDGSPVVVVWAEMPVETESVIVSGMTVEVELIAGEARGALLIPIQALHELSPGSFAVFVVQSNGEMRMTPVTIGLRDFANVEITSGLKVGDLVSTGTVEIK
jgi:RND family efflux transporter MFP subunit